MSNVPCAFQHRATPNHSDDRVTVYYGAGVPVVLCGYHASDGWLSRVFQWLNETRGADQ